MGSVGARVLDQKSAFIVPHDQQQHHQQQQQQQQQQQKQQNQEALRCPRCDSTNTKFCYYNNYSLSQPRHFCKACKRYWTRGGTLRNVPVGGGCRKNKRLKRPSNNNFISSTSSTTSNSSLTNSTTNSAASSGGGNNTNTNTPTNIHDLISSASNNHGLNPLFYHDNNLNFPFSRYDLQNPPQIHSLGLGFSSSSPGLVHNNDMGYNHHHHPKQIFQDLISSNPLLSTSTTTTSSCSSPSISSLLASTLQIKGGNNFHHQALLNMPNSYHEEDHSNNNDLQMKGGGVGGSNNGMYNNMKEVKMELEGQNRSNMHHWSISNNTNTNGTTNPQNHMDHPTINSSSSSDPSLLWGGSAWLDPSNNLGSSVPSLI